MEQILKNNWICNEKTELYLRETEFKEPKSLSSKYGELQCFVYSMLLFTFSVVYVQKKTQNPSLVNNDNFKLNQIPSTVISQL